MLGVRLVRHIKVVWVGQLGVSLLYVPRYCFRQEGDDETYALFNAPADRNTRSPVVLSAGGARARSGARCIQMLAGMHTEYGYHVRSDHASHPIQRRPS